MLTLVLVGGFARGLYYGYGGGGDVKRYLDLSSALLRGEYGLDFTPSTAFAPGYPLFLAFLRGVLPSLSAVIGAQLVLSIAVPVMVWAAGRNFSEMGARVGAVLLALSPMPASLAGTFLSETLSTALSGLLALALRSLLLHGPSLVRGLWLGVLAAAAAMTAPHMVVLVGLLGVGLLASRPSASLPLGFVLGCSLWFVPWQSWVVGVRGQPLVTLFDLQAPDYSFPRSGYAHWLKSWWETPGDLDSTLFYVPQPGQFPEKGLPKGLTQADVMPLTAPPGQAPWDLPSDTMSRYDELGSRIEGQQTYREKMRLLWRRLLSQWTHYDAGPAWNLLTGVAKDWPRPVQRGLWWGTLTLHWLLLAGFAVGLYGLLQGRPPLPYIALVPVAYTLLSALNLHEPRRNLTVIPILLFGLSVAFSRHRRASPPA